MQKGVSNIANRDGLGQRRAGIHIAEIDERQAVVTQIGSAISHLDFGCSDAGAAEVDDKRVLVGIIVGDLESGTTCSACGGCEGDDKGAATTIGDAGCWLCGDGEVAAVRAIDRDIQAAEGGIACVANRESARDASIEDA